MTQPNGDFTPRTRDGVSLKDYIDELNDAHCVKCTVCRKGIDDTFAAAGVALRLSQKTADSKFETVNEWRATYADLVEHKVDRNEYNESHRRLEDNLARTEVSLQSQIKATAANFEKDHKEVATNLNQLNLSEATLAGKASQRSVSVALIFSSLTLILAVIVIVLMLTLK